MAHHQHIVVGLLGPVAVIAAPQGDALDAETAVEVVPGLRAKRLLAALALANGRTLSPERLIADVWGADPPQSPNAALHTQISRLRQVLGPGHIDASGTGYRLSGCQTDLDLVAQLAERDTDAALDASATWWRGIPGDDLGISEFGGLSHEVAARAARLTDRLERQRFDRALHRHDYATARTIAENRCRRDAFDESAHLDLMRALAAEGRPADALREFNDLRRRLSSELGIEPGQQLAALYSELLTGSPTSAPAAVDPPLPAPLPSSRRTRATGLAAETTDLIGRETDITAITTLFAAHRLVTVQGPGGVGKTRIANRVGHELSAAGAAVFYVALAPVRNGDDVVAAIAATLGVGDAELSGHRPRLAVGDLRSRLVDTIRGRAVTLILDNCEQIIDDCAQIVAELLAADDSVRILITSRSPLMVSSERIYQLPVLDATADGSASALFAARASAVRPDADLPMTAVADLCRRLDGLPLAIELAAARIRTMSVNEISERLAERFALLRDTDRSAPLRHRTLSAVIEWSWDLLDANARAALCQLCRFPAGFTADAAAALLGYRGVALDDVLAALVNQSLLTLVERGGRVRYRMLETVREFGEEKLAAQSGQTEHIRAAMVTWATELAVTFADRSDSGVDEQLMESIAAEAENLIWVLRGCLETVAETPPALRKGLVADDSPDLAGIIHIFPVLAAYWMARGLHAEVADWGARILAVLPTPPSDLPVHLRRDWQITIMAAASHLVMRSDHRTLATARYGLRVTHRPSEVYQNPTDLLAACALSHDSAELIRHLTRGTRATDDRVVTTALAARMNLRENFGNLEGALRDARLLLNLHTAGRDSWLRAMADVNIGSLLGQQTEWSEAASFYHQGLEGLARIGALEDERQIRCYFAATLVALGELDSAAAELEIAGDGWLPGDTSPQATPELTAELFLAYGELDVARRRHDVAVVHFRNASHALRQEHSLGTQDPSVMMMGSLALIGLLRCGDEQAARVMLSHLSRSARATLSSAGWLDAPQAGTLALAAGYLLGAQASTREDGTRLLLLSRRLRARRDFPSLAFVFDHVRALSGASDAEWEAQTAATATLTRRQAALELRDILASYG